jgi:hypothetical protein
MAVYVLGNVQPALRYYMHTTATININTEAKGINEGFL